MSIGRQHTRFRPRLASPLRGAGSRRNRVKHHRMQHHHGKAMRRIALRRYEYIKSVFLQGFL
jgi:hypothetical protein